MRLRPPRSTLTDQLCPSTTLFRSVYRYQPSLFTLCRHAMRRFMLLFAGSVPTAARRGKAGKFPAQSGSKAIFLANRREILPMIGNGARDAVHRREIGRAHV